MIGPSTDGWGEEFSSMNINSWKVQKVQAVSRWCKGLSLDCNMAVLRKCSESVDAYDYDFIIALSAGALSFPAAVLTADQWKKLQLLLGIPMIAFGLSI